MGVISYIAIHHSGGTVNDPEASSLNLTAQKISEAHRIRWDFPSRHMKRADGTPWYAGYNVIYDPKDRSFMQTRAIGEETAAQYGYNFNTFSLCIIGNYDIKQGSWPRTSIDPMTRQIEEDVTVFLHDLIDGNRRGLFVAPGTTISLAIARVNPHRFYQATECYGRFLSDSHFRDLLIAYKPVLVPTPASAALATELEKRNQLIQALLQMIAKLQDVLATLKKNRNVGRLGAVGGRSCEGFIRI